MSPRVLLVALILAAAMSAVLAVSVTSDVNNATLLKEKIVAVQQRLAQHRDAVKVKPQADAMCQLCIEQGVAYLNILLNEILNNGIIYDCGALCSYEAALDLALSLTSPTLRPCARLSNYCFLIYYIFSFWDFARWLELVIFHLFPLIPLFSSLPPSFLPSSFDLPLLLSSTYLPGKYEQDFCDAMCDGLGIYEFIELLMNTVLFLRLFLPPFLPTRFGSSFSVRFDFGIFVCFHRVGRCGNSPRSC